MDHKLNQLVTFSVFKCDILQTYLHLAVLVDYTALDLTAVIRKEGDAEPLHLLAFAQAYQVRMAIFCLF